MLSQLHIGTVSERVTEILRLMPSVLQRRSELSDSEEFRSCYWEHIFRVSPVSTIRKQSCPCVQ
jgi:hypothetical protein